jgi:integrase
LLRRYRDEIVVHKRGAETEQSFIQFLLDRKLAAYALAHATPDVFRQFRDDRLREVSGGTVRRQLAVLRHEAISRFFEMGLSMPEVARISGHRDPRMLFRYTHLRAEDVVGKLK